MYTGAYPVRPDRAWSLHQETCQGRRHITRITGESWNVWWKIYIVILACDWWEMMSCDTLTQIQKVVFYNSNYIGSVQK